MPTFMVSLGTAAPSSPSTREGKTCAATTEAAPARRGRRRRGGGDKAGPELFPQKPFKQPRHIYKPVEAVSADELESIHEASMRVLEDIGIERSGIPAAVDRAMEKVETKTCPASRVSAAQVQSLTQQALGTLPPLRRRPAERAVAATKQAPVLPMWLGPWLNLSPGYHAR